MSSGITFSGFNNIDFSAILNLVMQQERAPLNALESRKSALETQNGALATFATKLAALETAAAGLADADNMAGLSAASSNDSVVGVSATTGTVAGSYDVAVTAIARSQVSVSQTSFASVDATVATTGTFVIAGADAESSVEIAIDAATSLSQLVGRINDSAHSPVVASIVRVAAGDYRLVLTGTSTGEAQSFTYEVTSALGGGTGLAFQDFDGNGVSGDSASDNTQNAADAAFSVNNLSITSDSNTVTDVIPGATLTLRRTSTDAVRVDVSRSHDAAVAAAERFVTAYNDVIAFIKAQSNDAAAGKAGIARDPLVRSLRDALRSTLSGAHGSGDLQRLAEIGIAADRLGTLELDEEMFRAALEESPDDVRQLLAGTDGTSGASGALQTLLKGYTSTGGLVADARQRLDSQLLNLRDRMADMEVRLEHRRRTLQQEYAAADRAMSQLNSQGSSLGALSSQYRLF
jgi:flagellar hook-associated protein 2